MKAKRTLAYLLTLAMLLPVIFSGAVLSAVAVENSAETVEDTVAHSYIRTGLYAWYSGEQNTRGGQNTDSTVWHDLISGQDMTVGSDANNYFTSEGLHVKNARHDFPEEIVNLVNGPAFTVEIEFGDFTSIGTDFNTFMNSSNDNFALFRRNANNVIEFKFGGGSVRPKVPDGLNHLNNHLLTVTFEYGEAVIMYIDGVEMARSECMLYMGANDLFIGHTTANKLFETTYKNIRFYTRSLSASEVKHNAAVDGYVNIEDIYVQDGLVSLYSGVANTENGYDAAASVWTDRVGENDLPMTLNKSNYFTPAGFRVIGPDTTIHMFPQTIVDLVNGQEFTVELHFGDFLEVGEAYGTFLNSANDNFALFRQVGTDQLSFKYAGNVASQRPFIDDALNLLNNGLISVTYRVGEKCRIYINGTLMTETDSPNAMGADNLFIGQRSAVKTFDSTYKSIRFYNRALTAAEVYANATADGVTFVMDEAMSNPGYVTVAQPVTNIVGDIATIRPIGSQSEFTAMMNSSSPAAVGLYTIDHDLQVLDDEGKPFSTVADVLIGSEYKVLSCFRISDTATADVLAEYTSGIRFSDFFLMSDDKEVLKYAREKMTNSYGVLDLRAEYAHVADLSEEQLLDIRRAVKTYHASVAVLPAGICFNEDVQYLYDRQVNVWAWASDHPDEAEQYFALLSGAVGVVSDATEKLLDVACNKLAENTMTRLPLNIGHRGLPSSSPENCIEGALYAYEQGAEVIEIDVYLTKDNQAVLMHDGTTGRTCNKDISVEGSTLEELTALYCNKGYETNERFKDAKVPSLDAFLAALRDTDARFYIEIKSSAEALVPIVKELVEKYDLYGRCSIITFSTTVMANFRKYYPEMSVGALCSAYMNGDNPESEFRFAMSFIGKYNATLNPQCSANGSASGYNYDGSDLRAALLRGIQIHPWTFAGNITAYENHFLWGYCGLTGNNANVFKKLTRRVALPEELNLTVGDNALSLTLTTYGRLTDDSDKLTVTVLGGNATAEGNTLTVTREGDVTFITASSHKIGRMTSYTLYTQPVTVKAVSGEISTEPVDTETAAPDGTNTQAPAPDTDAPIHTDASTDGDTTGGDNNGGCKSIVGGMTIALLTVCGAAVAVARKKRED